MTDLVDALARLEDILTRSRAQVLRNAHPGINEEELTQALAPLGLTPTEELTSWFGWHNGAGGPGMPKNFIDLAPMCALNPVAELVAECQMQREVAARLGAAGIGLLPEDQWREGWFPVQKMWGKGNVVVDLRGGSGATPVHVVWVDAQNEERDRVRWPSMAAFVGELVLRFEDGRYAVDEDGVVQGPAVDYW